MRVAGQVSLEQSQDQVYVQASLVGLVNHDHAEVGDPPADDPVDKGAVGDVDQLVAPIHGRSASVAEPHIEAGAEAGTVQVTGHKRGDAARGLDAGLGYDDLSVPRELVWPCPLWRVHQAIGQERGFAAAGWSFDHCDLVLAQDVEQLENILIFDAELYARIRQVELGLDLHPLVLTLRMRKSSQSARAEFDGGDTGLYRLDRVIGEAHASSLAAADGAALRAAFRA